MSVRAIAPKVVGGVLLAAIVGFFVVVGVMQAPASEPASAAESSSAVINEDHGGLPACTDAIADAGGMCWGEPTAEPNGLAESEVNEYAAPAPSAENTPETWVPGTPETQVFSDGSWLAADGTMGCTPGAACDQLPPVPAGEQTTPTGGYYPTLELRPCPTEDSDNCYWDATRMGNGDGTSFIAVDGIYYYPEVIK